MYIQHYLHKIMNKNTLPTETMRQECKVELYLEVLQERKIHINAKLQKLRSQKEDIKQKYNNTISIYGPTVRIHMKNDYNILKEEIEQYELELIIIQQYIDITLKYAENRS